MTEYTEKEIFNAILRARPETVKVLLTGELRHAEGSQRFTCLAKPHHHGTFWRKKRDVLLDEAEGRSGCPICNALQETGDTVPFNEMAEQVKEQRKREATSARKSMRAAHRGNGSSYGLNKYAL